MITGDLSGCLSSLAGILVNFAFAISKKLSSFLTCSIMSQSLQDRVEAGPSARRRVHPHLRCELPALAAGSSDSRRGAICEKSEKSGLDCLDSRQMSRRIPIRQRHTYRVLVVVQGCSSARPHTCSAAGAATACGNTIRLNAKTASKRTINTRHVLANSTHSGRSHPPIPTEVIPVIPICRIVDPIQYRRRLWTRWRRRVSPLLSDRPRFAQRVGLPDSAGSRPDADPIRPL